MTERELFPSLLKGLGTDLLITALAVILPLIVGIGLTLLMHFTRKTALPKVFRYVSVITEGLCPLLILPMIYYVFPQLLTMQYAVNPVFISSAGLSLCFLGYMAYRYDGRDSLCKNIVVNGIGLVADMMKWCFASTFMIGVSGLVGAARNYSAYTYHFFGPYFSATIIILVVLVVLYIARQICKDLLK